VESTSNEARPLMRKRGSEGISEIGYKAGKIGISDIMALEAEGR
jgi:hypothetical protein